MNRQLIFRDFTVAADDELKFAADNAWNYNWGASSFPMDVVSAKAAIFLSRRAPMTSISMTSRVISTSLRNKENFDFNTFNLRALAY